VDTLIEETIFGYVTVKVRQQTYPTDTAVANFFSKNLNQHNIYCSNSHPNNVN
jgi:hypothetical protein